MRALTYAAFGGPLTVSDLADPTAPPGGAVVRVRSSGLCRSDWHAWMGHDTDIEDFPHVPGHEFAGTVVAVGDGVDSAWLGREVTAPFVFACGECQVCRSGAGQVCPRQRQPGFSDPGSFAEQVVVQAAGTNLVALPEGLSHDVAAGLGCRIATAYRAVTARAQVQEGETVAIFGCGGVGLAATMIATARGARVIAVDIAESAMARAREVGAWQTLRADHDVLAAISDLTGGGADVAIDALGSLGTCRASVLSLGRRGRQVQIGLLPSVTGSPEVPMERVISWELDILGCHGMAAADYEPLLTDVVSGRLDIGRLLAQRDPIGLAEAAEALPAMGTASSEGIVLVDPSR